MLSDEHIDPLDAGRWAEFLDRNPDAAFYDGKVQSSRFFIKNVLPQADALAAAIRNEDLSAMAVHDGGF
jgi:Acetyl-CoA dehydrogenase C-terminal like